MNAELVSAPQQRHRRFLRCVLHRDAPDAAEIACANMVRLALWCALQNVCAWSSSVMAGWAELGDAAAFAAYVAVAACGFCCADAVAGGAAAAALFAGGGGRCG